MGRDEAMRMLDIAQKEATALTDAEQKDKAELLKRAGTPTP
jgi:hypothetical protein